MPAFTGRDGELARLAGLAGGGRVVVSAIGGTAGVGKTTLAVHAAHQLLGQFPDGHLYADLRGYTEGQDPAEPGEVLEVFLRRLGVPAEEMPATVEDRSGLLRQVLAGRRVLMVLDNARSEGQVRPLLPGAGGSLVLVTSRSALPGLEVDERISLDILPPDEAAAMLAAIIGVARAGVEREAIAEVAGLCGRLPLALRIAGQLLAAHPRWPVARLAGMLAGERDRLARLGAGDLQVRAAFEVSYRQLAEEDARVFRRLALHPGPDFTAACGGGPGRDRTGGSGAGAGPAGRGVHGHRGRAGPVRHARPAAPVCPRQLPGDRQPGGPGSGRGAAGRLLRGPGRVPGFLRGPTAAPGGRAGRGAGRGDAAVDARGAGGLPGRAARVAGRRRPGRPAGLG